MQARRVGCCGHRAAQDPKRGPRVALSQGGWSARAALAAALRYARTRSAPVHSRGALAVDRLALAAGVTLYVGASNSSEFQGPSDPLRPGIYAARPADLARGLTIS